MIFNLVVGLIALFLASIEDIKKREVPDIISFSLIGIAIGSSVVLSIYHSNFTYFLYSISGLIIALIIGAFFYYTGQWGGGDYKIVMGLGALFGVNIFQIGQIPQFLVFIVNSFLVGAIFGVIWIVFLAIKNWKKFIKEFDNHRSSKTMKKQRKIFLIAIPLLVIIIWLFPIDVSVRLILTFVVALVYLSFYISMLIKAVEKSSMIKSLKVSKLTEGDWIVGDVIVKGKKFTTGKTGLTFKDIDYLKKNKVKEVTVKEGMPFLPSFFIAYILTYLIGNWIYLLGKSF